MNKEDYQKALKSIKWVTKRNKIKKRDGNKCTKCGSTKSLHVHHTYYLKDKMPWEVPDECLVTLCKICHEKAHEGREIKSFFRVNPPKKSKTIKIKSNSCKTDTLSQVDIELQVKYNDLKRKGKLPECTYKPLENPIRPIPKRRKKKRKKK